MLPLLWPLPLPLPLKPPELPGDAVNVAVVYKAPAAKDFIGNKQSFLQQAELKWMVGKAAIAGKTMARGSDNDKRG